MTEKIPAHRPGRLAIPRTRGAASGLLLIVLGVWGASAPFVGPYLDIGYPPDGAWTAARGLLQVLPGAVCIGGGVLLLASGNRATAMLGGWLGVAAGGWFVVGRTVAVLLPIGDIGAPSASTDAGRLLIELLQFSGLGVLVVFVAAAAVGRVSVRSVRDIDYRSRAVDAPAAEAGQPA